MLTVYVASSFVSAVLVFSVQPLASRLLLPSFGGSAAVWTTSVLFFQLVLLLGYLYTHLATRSLRRRTQVGLHLVLLLLPLLVLPLSVSATPGAGGTTQIVVRLLSGLAVGVGLPFLLVSTSGPLLQRWFSWTDHPRADDPYFLYAASNLGSILGLLTYPVLVEPNLRLGAQSSTWTAGYVALVMLIGGCAWMMIRRPGASSSPKERAVADAPGARAVWRWVGLAFVPSSLMLGVTTFLSTDIAAIPLLWVVPLALYLATFVVAFGTRSGLAHRIGMRLFAPVTLLAAAAWLAGWSLPLTIALMMASFLAIAMIFHHRLAASRPGPDGLTGFYVWMSVGGALGGVANGIVAPLLLPGPYEFLIVGIVAAVVAGRSLSALRDDAPRMVDWLGLVLSAAAVVAIATSVRLGWGPATTVVVITVAAWWAYAGIGQTHVAMLGAFLLLAAPSTSAYLTGVGESTRSFYGSYRVDRSADQVALYSGTTLHGLQSTAPDRRNIPLSYYHPDGPVGDWLPLSDPDGQIGVVGLGAGSMAAYAEDGQSVRFHEIDATVESLAERSFTFLDDTPARVDVVIGDGRLTLQEVKDGEYDLLALDAFSSDSIPVHLLTREAFEEYDRVLSDDGILLVHISNRYLDLEPVVAAGADAIGMEVRTRSASGDEEGELAAKWMALGRGAAAFDVVGAEWQEPSPRRVPWTDDFSNIVEILR